MKKYQTNKKEPCANPNALPALLDKDAETKRLDSIRESADAELNENDRVKVVNKTDEELMKKWRKKMKKQYL